MTYFSYYFIISLNIYIFELYMEPKNTISSLPNKQVKSNLQQKLTLRGFKSLNRKTIHSPAALPTQNVVHNPYSTITNMGNIDSSSGEQKNKSKSKNTSIQSNNNNSNKENIKDNINTKSDKNEATQPKQEQDQIIGPLATMVGYHRLHGRTYSGLANPIKNRSSSKNKKHIFEMEKTFIPQNESRKDQDEKQNTIEEKRSCSRKSKRGIENSPVSNQSKQVISNKKTINKPTEIQNIINMYRSPIKQDYTYSTVTNPGSIICESVSKDGQFKVTSRCLTSQQLKDASQLEHHINMKSKRQAIKELQENTPNSHHHSTSASHRNGQGQVHMNHTSSPRSNKYILDPSKISSKENGNVKAYAVNSNQGISRKYNQDRVSIILNIMKNGIRASFFAIYDGHGGATCCDFLTQNLHQYVFNSKYFPAHPRQALIEGMKLAQSKFIESTKALYRQKKEIDRSGSCAIILLIVGDDCYIANLGDSRAILSTCSGKPMYSLSRDHKPTDPGEQARILKEGGKIYRTQMIKLRKQSEMEIKEGESRQARSFSKKQQRNGSQNDVIIGPLRVYPGKLSVTRTFGDIQAKQPELGGIKNCISTDPQICKYTLTGKEDFIILGCDGLFEKLDSQEVIQQAWRAIKKSKKSTIHEAVGSATQSVVKLCMDRKGTDNITAITVCLGSLGLESNISDYSSV